MFPPGGPIYSSLYGPLVAVVYLPATWFPSPNSAVLAGAAITVLLCFSAMALLHFVPFGRGGTRIELLAFLAAGYLVCFLEPLKYSCVNIHADGPGLAFAAIACVAVYPGILGKWRCAVPLSALCAVLAIFSKQLFLPVPFALLLYCWAAAGRARAKQYLVWLSITGGAAAALAILVYGPAPLYHCLLWLPAHQPWNDPSRLVAAAQALRAFIRLSMPVPILILAMLAFLWNSERSILRRADLRAMAAHRATPLLAVGMALLPCSIAGRAKVGGDINSLSFSLFFLTCGLTLMLAGTARNAHHDRRRVAFALLLAIMLPLALFEMPLAFDLGAACTRVSASQQQVAFEYLVRHPGQAYFPWLPQSHYYAEHRFRHYSYGIADRLLAGEPVTGSEFRAYIPRDPKVIAFGADGTPDIAGYDLMKFLPEFRYRVQDLQLPGWLVYAKSARKKGTA